VMFFGHTALGAVPIMRWIAPLPFLIAVSNVLGIQTMLVFGLDKQFSRILISAGIVNILLGAPLIIWLGAIGAGISVLVTETLVTSAMVVVLRNHRIIIPLGLKTAV
jgi:polysaccharide transporter, PST family